MAQAVRHDKVEFESLLSQAKEKAPLIQKGANGQQIPGAYVPAGELKYNKPEGWTISQRYAALMGSNTLGVQGECSAKELGQFFFQGSLEVMLGNNCNINEVELKRTLPDGSVETEKISLATYPKNKRISLKVGAEFFNWSDSGNIELELNGTESETLKKGLVIFGVQIKQIIDPTTNAFKTKA